MDEFCYMDNKIVTFIINDIKNNKRFSLRFYCREHICNFKWDYYNNENYEIIMILWGEYCIYNSLVHDKKTIEEIISFFE